MKKVCILWIFIVIVATGCISMQNKRGVKNNIFYSSYPEIAVKLSQELKFFGNMADNEFGFYLNSETGSNQSNEKFLFRDKNKETWIIFSINKIQRGFFLPNQTPTGKKIILSNQEDHYGKRYHYDVWAQRDKKNHACSLIKQYYRIAGGKGEILIKILYIQQQITNEYDCNHWQDINMLTNAQRGTLQKFMKNSTEKMQFIDYSDVSI